MNWKCLIVDDDPVQCELITSYCNAVRYIDSVDIAHSGKEATEKIRHAHYDLIFLDLNMPLMSGKELLDQLSGNIPVIMVTADPGFAVESYHYNVVGYLVKPVTSESFQKTIEHYRNQVYRQDYINVKEGTAQVKVRFDDLRYVKSESNYVVFHLENKRILSLMRLSDLEAELPDSFIRVHRSYIVNTAYIQEASTAQIKIGQTKIPVSDSYRKEVRKRILS